MVRENVLTVEIDTDPERAFYFGPSQSEYVWPVRLSIEGRTIIDFNESAYNNEELNNFNDLRVEYVNDIMRDIALPKFVTRSIANYLRSTDRKTADFNCMNFAWAACRVPNTGPHDATYTPIEEVRPVKSGDLVSVGTITNWMGFEFAKLIDMKHWAVYLTDGMTLNVTGSRGILAATPLDNFRILYPETKTYIVTDFQRVSEK